MNSSVVVAIVLVERFRELLALCITCISRESFQNEMLSITKQLEAELTQVHEVYFLHVGVTYQ